MPVARAMLLGLILLCVGSPMSRVASAARTWTEIGDIQILEGPEAIWVFVEVVRRTDHGLASYRAEELVSQSVFTVERPGNVTETVIAGDAGPRFDPVLCPIFRLPDGLYLYQCPAADRPASLYRWGGDRFRPLDERESTDLTRSILRRPYPGVLDDLEALSAASGWRCASRQQFDYDDPMTRFVSDMHQIKISVLSGDRRAGQGDATARPSADVAPPRRRFWRDLRENWRLVREWPEIVASLRSSAVVATSVSETGRWSRTLIEVDTKSKKVRRSSAGRGRAATPRE